MTDAVAEQSRPPTPAGRFARAVHRIAVGLALLGGAVLTTIAALTTVSIASRWMLGAEIPGMFEIVQVGLALAAFLFLPLCQARSGNIVVDAFTSRAPRRLRLGLDAAWALLFAATAAVLAWRLAIGAAETVRSGTVSAMIRLPFGWAMAAGAAALLFLAVVAAVTARHRPGDPLT